MGVQDYYDHLRLVHYNIPVVAVDDLDNDDQVVLNQAVVAPHQNQPEVRFVAKDVALLLFIFA